MFDFLVGTPSGDWALEGSFHMTVRSENSTLVIGERLRAWRGYRALSQNEREERLGPTRYYISRVENRFTIPRLETLERFARALEVPVSQLVYEEEDPYPPPSLPASKKCRGPSGICQKNLCLLEQFNLFVWPDA
jgi:transcriptional regulator with XRE-family HTH domain